MPKKISSNVEKGLGDMLDNLNEGVESSNRRLQGETNQLKALSLQLIKERQGNEQEVETLRKRIADSHYKNLVHKENVLGIFSKGCTGLFGNYYQPSLNCTNHCCHEKSNCKFVSYLKPIVEDNTFNTNQSAHNNQHQIRNIQKCFEFKIESPSGHEIDYLDTFNLNHDKVNSKNKENYLGMESLFYSKKPKRKKRSKNKKKIKDLMRLHRNMPLLKKVNARKYSKGYGLSLLESKGLDPNDLLEFDKFKDSETLMLNNNVYLNYLLNNENQKLLSETRYLGENEFIFK